MVVEIKTDKRRYILLLLSLILISSLSYKVHLTLFPEKPIISSVYGDIEIFVNGIWIPLKAGMDISFAKIRMKGPGEIRIGDKVIRSEEGETIFSLSDEGKINVQKGNIIIDDGKGEILHTETGKNISPQEPEKFPLQEPEKFAKLPETMEVEKPSEVTIVKAKIEDEKIETTSLEDDEDEIPKILSVSIRGVKEENGRKYIASRRAVLDVVTENINEISVNGHTYFSNTGKFKIQLFLREGENTIEILGIDKNERIVSRTSETVFVDTKPPTVKFDKIKGKIKFELEELELEYERSEGE